MTPTTSKLPDSDAVRATETVIRPHIRRTPVLDVDGADFGLPGLEPFQVVK